MTKNKSVLESIAATLNPLSTALKHAGFSNSDAPFFFRKIFNAEDWPTRAEQSKARKAQTGKVGDRSGQSEAHWARS